MLKISNSVTIQEWEIQLSPIRAQGNGGQNVNKVASAIHLRFDIRHSSLPDFYKERLLALSDSRISKDGVIIIKAQQFRTQEQNKEDALNRLQALIKAAALQDKKRIKTKPTRASQRRRLDTKNKHGAKKQQRKKVLY
ncbi:MULTISPECIES: alternative ribosome rescue aminoacyl-tRNA hydrolase ArfB [Vibrio]|uniref:alternative ribosome rescue aminoacyl-tRNA hydrolase ArfB n=1 Tax=Vibrio TaxID=662 RepID=UPI001EED34BE|nr:MULTISPECIES: alternative ribosome rescue aminoacyl-tRNA hydrolase ArfB [Vibrio]ELB2831384.1 aminoacyl-tRNA hydrolase [Vibrio alginolyticus]ELB2835313.1 aminoacyl-tRNA hydrolase [Vibrio alginolyticus]EMC2460139.1 aminoacyl-tRNA hydrolase [Vibrio alginolyticus]MCR9588527.1 aminoacyl-tRNA hydrolase [Vibrio alginolyticus]MCS0300793.1 aminoacyl-tRNA hydrolase [Vibrio alginolyticus]